MGTGHWIKRFCLAFLGAAVLLCVLELVKGHDWLQALRFAALWGTVFAALFTGIGYARFKRNPACMLPPDKRPPEPRR